MIGKTLWIKPWSFLFLLALVVLLAGNALANPNNQELPVKGMVNMIDVGAGSCIPCKMMAPILEELKKEYEGRAVIQFVDTRFDRSAIEKYRLKGIPTQVFYDKEGREVFRHLGFMDKAAIVQALKKLGVN